MFVVKRPFKSFGKVFTAGSIIDKPAEIKRFKGRIAEGKIVEITEQNYNSVAKYFKDKYNVTLPPLHEEVVEPEPAKQEPVKPEANTKAKVVTIAASVVAD